MVIVTTYLNNRVQWRDAVEYEKVSEALDAAKIEARKNRGVKYVVFSNIGSYEFPVEEAPEPGSWYDINYVKGSNIHRDLAFLEEYGNGKLRWRLLQGIVSTDNVTSINDKIELD